MRVNTLIMLAMVLVAGCTTCTPIPGPGPGPGPTTTTFTLTNPATCEDACKRLGELGCPAAKPTEKGTTCTEVCENAEHSGLTLWGTRCMVRATSCAEADACGSVP